MRPSLKIDINRGLLKWRNWRKNKFTECIHAFKMIIIVHYMGLLYPKSYLRIECVGIVGCMEFCAQHKNVITWNLANVKPYAKEHICMCNVYVYTRPISHMLQQSPIFLSIFLRCVLSWTCQYLLLQTESISFCVRATFDDLIP